MDLFGSNLWTCFLLCVIWDTHAHSLMSYYGFMMQPYCSDVFGYHRSPQTLVALCRDMGISGRCRLVATGETYPGFILIDLIVQALCTLRNLYEQYLCINSLWPSDAMWHQRSVSIGSGNGLAPVRCQAITWTMPELLLIGTLLMNLRKIWVNKWNFSFKKMHLKMLSAKCGTFGSGLIMSICYFFTCAFCLVSECCCYGNRQVWHIENCFLPYLGINIIKSCYIMW